MKKVIEKIDNLDAMWHTKLENKGRTIGSIRVVDDIEFKEIHLGLKNIIVVELSKFKKIDDEEQVEESIKMEIYDEKMVLIAVIDKENNIKFEEEYLKQLKDINTGAYEKLDLENTKLEEETLKFLMQNEKDNDDKVKNKEDKESKEREETARILGIKPEEVKNIAKIDQYKKITADENLVNMIPETGKYKEVSIVHQNNSSEYDGFVMIGKKEDGTMERIDEVEGIKGTSTNKNVISINDDGSEIIEKQVRGLMQINTKNRNHGISISVGDYGMMDIDFVSDINRDDRRTTPIATDEMQNRRVATSKIKENAADSLGEVRDETENFRRNEEEGIKEQTIDGIDEDRADGTSRTFQDLKNDLKEYILEHEEIQSPKEIETYIKYEISKSEFNLNEYEIEKVIKDIREDVEFESRFPRREF